MTGRGKKHVNALISASFVIPAVLVAHHYHPALWLYAAGLLAGFLWANWFEYFYHRWLDHTPGSYFEKKHRIHHAQPENEDHHNLGDSPFDTLGMFLVNWLPVLAADLFWLHSGVSAPVLLAFVVYVLVMEEVHWRMHTGEWVPEGWRQYHLAHHGMGLTPTGGRTKFNIFIPLFDWLFGTL